MSWVPLGVRKRGSAMCKREFYAKEERRAMVSEGCEGGEGVRRCEGTFQTFTLSHLHTRTHLRICYHSPMPAQSLDQIVSLCKRRGFIFPGSDIYGGLANTWDYGPLGTELKKRVQQSWWDTFVRRRPEMMGIETGILMHPKV